MKKVLLTLLVLAICISAVACELNLDGKKATITNELTRLSAPTNVRIENGFIYWSAVSNADRYVVQVGDESNQATTTELCYPISSLRLIEGQTYYAKVKALPSSSILYSESEWSGLSAAYVHGENNGNIVRDDEGNKVTIALVSVVSTQNPNYTDYTSYKTGNKWYYVFDLGTLYNVQLEDGYAIPFQGVATTLTFQTSTTTSETIQRYSERAASYSTTKSSSVSASSTITAGIPNKASVSVSVGYSQSSTSTYTKSEKESSTYASQQANTESKTLSYVFNKDNTIGMYSYVLLGNVEVYEIVMYDAATGQYYIDEVSIVKSSNRALVYLGEFGTVYQNYADKKLHFDTAIIDTLQEPTTEHYDSQREIIQLTPQNCEDNNGYDSSKPSGDNLRKTEINPHVVDLYIDGCHKLDSGKYVIADSSALDIGFIFVQGANSGDIASNRDAIFSAEVASDTWNSSVKDTNISGTINKGAYFLKVYYKDGSSDEGITKCNFMNGHIATDEISIATITDFNQTRSVSKVLVTCVYEINAYWKDGLGWVTYHTPTNWRCDYTILFN